MGAALKVKVGRFGSLISLIALSTMLMIFSAALPQFLATVAGQVFAAVWGLMAISAFAFHASRLQSRREKMRAVLPDQIVAGRDARTPKTVRLRRHEV